MEDFKSGDLVFVKSIRQDGVVKSKKGSQFKVLLRSGKTVTAYRDNLIFKSIPCFQQESKSPKAGDAVYAWNDEKTDYRYIYLGSISWSLFPHMVCMIEEAKQIFIGKSVNTMSFKHVEVVKKQTEMTVEEIESKLSIKQGTLKIIGGTR